MEGLKTCLFTSRIPLILRSRWVGLAAASWVEACAGLSYMFGLYSQSIRTSLGYSQTMLDLVGMAKDAGGSLGLVSGILADSTPPWVVLLLGGLQSLVGFGGLWLVLSGLVANPQLWLVMGLIAVGSNSATFYNTGGMIICVKNFPHSRGPVVGLLKGFMGLSGALFSQLYLALYAPNPASFTLLAAWFPALVALIAMPLIHPARPNSYHPQERARLLKILFGSLGLAAFLLGANMLGHFVQLSRWWNLGVAGLSLFILASPAHFALQQLQEEGLPGVLSGEPLEGQALMAQESAEAEMTSLGSTKGARAQVKQWGQDGLVGIATSTVRLRQHEGKEGDDSVPIMDVSTKGVPMANSEAQLALGSSPGEPHTGRRASAESGRLSGSRIEVGEDHNLLQAACTLPFWILFATMVFASGSGLTAINNIAQYGHSLGHGHSDIAVAVSLLSIWNFLGRVGAAYLSEHFLTEQTIPRPAFMCLTQLLLACGHGIFACSLPGSLLVGSAVVGLAYGSQWSLMPAIASEIFGLRYFGMIYNTLTITNPAGSYLLSVCVAGRLYDLEASRQAAVREGLTFSPSPAPAPAASVLEAATCLGPECFRITFLILALSSVFAACLSAVLAVWTWRYYIAAVTMRKNLSWNNTPVERCG